MKSLWTYDEQTRTVKIDYIFNDKLTGLPADTKAIIFKKMSLLTF